MSKLERELLIRRLHALEIGIRRSRSHLIGVIQESRRALALLEVDRQIVVEELLRLDPSLRPKRGKPSKPSSTQSPRLCVPPASTNAPEVSSDEHDKRNAL